MECIGTDREFSSKYGGNGCPDKSANGMFTYAKSKGCEWGTMDSLPELPGVALRSDGHVGVYIGGRVCRGGARFQLRLRQDPRVLAQLDALV